MLSITRGVSPNCPMRVKHPDAATGNRPYRQFLMIRNSKLPNEKNIKIGVQRLGNFESDRHAATRKREQ